MLQGLELNEDASGKLFLKGRAVFEYVSMLEHIELFKNDSKSLEISLAQVEKADSAGLALLLEWVGRARRKNVDLRYTDVPFQLQALAKLSNL